MLHHSASRLALVIGLVAGGLAGSETMTATRTFGQGIFRPSQGAQPGRFIEAPRATEQKLREAQEAIDAGRFSEAVVGLGDLLSRDQAQLADDGDLAGQDFFLDIEKLVEGQPIQDSLLGRARDMIGGLPGEAIETYELRYGAVARKLLDEAASARDWEKVRLVRRKYFHTLAGYEASWLLAQREMFAGRPLGSSLFLDDVTSIDRAVGHLGLGSVVLHAAACRLAGRDLPESVLGRSEAGEVTVGGSLQTLPAADRWDPWLEKFAARGGTFSGQPSDDYPMFGSTPDRNGESTGQMPLTNLRWMLSTTASPRQERSLRDVADELTTTGKLPPPSWVPLRVGDQLLMRTTERLVGVDYRTGKRVWTYPWQSAYEAIDDEELSFDDIPGEDDAGDLLTQRVWNDLPYGHITSDSERVFMLDDLGEVEMIAYNPMIVMRGTRPADTSTNTLVALEMATEGKLLWRRGAGDDGVSTLSEAFFLGPPLPLDGRLYVMVEIAGDINLCCLDPVTGDELWRQHLVAVESGGINGDPIRRVAGAMPTYHEGLLICPTGAGATVAIDLSDRMLRWGVTYARNNERNRNLNIRGRGIDASQLMQRWDSGFAMASGTRMLVTPVESDRLFGLDVLTGKRLFGEKNRVQMRYLAGIRNDQFYVVGGNQVRAYDLKTGNSVWTTPRDMLTSGQYIAGRGVFGPADFFIPTTSNQLVQISLADGSVVDRRSTQYPLGNLVAVDGQVIVQGPTSLAVAYGEKSLEPIVNARLESDPNDFEAMVRKSELLIQQGERAEALELLTRARAIEPDNDEVHLLSVSAMLGTLRDDVEVDEAMVETLEALIDRPSQRVELLSLRIRAAMRQGQYVTAAKRLLDFSELLVSEPNLESVSDQVINDPARQCTLDGWLAARVQQVVTESGDEDLAQINELVLAAANLRANGSTGVLERFVRHFRAVDGSRPVKVELVRRFRENEDFLRCERLLLGTQVPSELGLAGLSQADMVELAMTYAQGGLGEDASFVSKQLASRDDGQETPADEAVLFPDRMLPEWPRKVDLEWDSLQTRTTMGNTSQRVAKTTVLAGQKFVGWELIADAAAPMAMRDPSGSKRMIPMEGLRQGDDVDKEAQISGGAMMVLLPTGLACIDLYHLIAGDGEAVIWQRGLSGDGSPVAKRRSFVTPFGDQVVRYYINATGTSNVIPEFKMGPVMGDRVLILQGGDLMAIDLAGKQTIWRNSSAPQSGAVLCDGRRVAVVSPSTNEVMFFDIEDGTKLATEPWSHGAVWESVGRNVLCYKQLDSGTLYEVNLIDPFTGEVKLQAQSHSANRGNVDVPSGYGRIADGRILVMLQSDGKSLVWDLATAREIGRPELPEFSDLQSLHLAVLRDQVILLPKRRANRPNLPKTEQLQTADGSFHQTTHGVYAVSLTDGSLRWSHSFEKPWGCTLTQPADSPILLLTRSPFTYSVQSRKKYLDVLAIDVRDGTELSETLGREILSNNNDLECRLTIQPGLSRVIAQIGPELLTFNFGEPEAKSDQDAERVPKEVPELDDLFGQ